LDVSWSDESKGLFLPELAAYMENEKKQNYESFEIPVCMIYLTIN